MCSISGIASNKPIQNTSILASARDLMSHRGPDDSGVWWSHNKCVGLAHSRLSVIELSSAGHQPMHDVQAELTIVFNGEIYNYIELREELKLKGYSFTSESDTEVILGAYREWNIDCLSHLNGMFAFSIYDGRSKDLFVARDRVGEKPLFYIQERGVLRFASELKSLMADPSFSRRLDLEGLDCYLAMGFVPGDRCILQGVHKLPPAHALLYNIESKQSRVWQYWNLPDFYSSGSGEHIDEVHLLNELENLFEDSVSRQLIADVPVGVLLSGGIDSSLVTAMAVRSSSKVKTFTIRFPGFGSYDETKHARLIADYFSTEHIELDAVDATVDLLPMLAHQFDEPVVDSSMIPTYLVSKLIRQHCTVALGGDGGDELFGGYNHYSRLLWMHQKFSKIPQVVRSSIARSAEFLLPYGYKGRNWLQGLDVNLKSGLPLIASYYDRRVRSQLMSRFSSWRLIAEDVREQRIPATTDLLQRATRMDFRNYLAEDILVKVDRSSMLNSLELRSPFLDYRLIEFAFSKVPSYLKATPTSQKVLLKNLTARLLPAEFERNRKQGFSIPLSSWLQGGSWKDFFHEILMSPENVLFDKRIIKKLFEGELKGRANSERLFALVLFELWRREYNILI